MQNALAMNALALSTDAFPDVPKSRVRGLHMPILIVTGASTIAIHRLVNDELTRLLPPGANGYDFECRPRLATGEPKRVQRNASLS